MIQEFHLWVQTQKMRKRGLKEVCVHPHSSSMVYSSQGVEATQLRTGRCVYKPNVHAHSPALFCLGEEEILSRVTDAQTWRHREKEASHDDDTARDTTDSRPAFARAGEGWGVGAHRRQRFGLGGQERPGHAGGLTCGLYMLSHG